MNYNEDLGYIAVNAKHWSTFFVIDHDGTFISGDPGGSRALAATAAGDFLYRWGNPSAYKQGKAPGYLDEGDQQMYGAHNIQWIKKTAYTGGPVLPGAGHFLIFNNGCYNPRGFHSETIEINPYLDAAGNDTGSYVNPPDAGYDASNRSKQIVWLYQSNNPHSFFARHISGMTRMPNGNTVICAGTQGHLFEVTATGEVVWDYVIPRLGYTVRTDNESVTSFRCYRYGPDYPGLRGKDLTPKGKMTELVFRSFEDGLDAFRNRK